MQFNNSSTGSSKGGGLFLTLKDGESAVGVFRGEPVTYFAKWVNGKTYPCSEDEDEASFKFRINFLTRENEVLVAKIFEKGAPTYRDLQAIHQEFNLEETIVKVTRTGEGKESRYKVMPVKENKVSAEMEAQLKAVTLKDLTPKTPDAVQV